MGDVWTMKKVLDWTIEYFASKNIPEPRLSAELLLAHILNARRIDIYVQFERILSPDERNAYRNLIQRRAQREPVQYILGETEFMGFPFKVSPAVLIPRPDTEILVDSVVEYIKSLKDQRKTMLDIGAGSGCIAVSLAKIFPGSEMWAIEKSPAALAIAKENAAINDVSIRFVEGDFFEHCSDFNIRFDIIVTNPPYISSSDWEKLQPEVRRYEPRDALYGGENGTEFFRRLIPATEEILKPGGSIFLETGYDQARIVAGLLQKAGYQTELRRDYSDIERVVIARRNSSKDK